MNLQKINKTSLFRKFHGFTLIELIVVITILAILGTIGFLSIWGYSSKARDSARVGDAAQISKSLDLSIVTMGDYPVPDNAFSVTYSGGVVWNQGTIGSRVLQAFRSSIAGGGLNDKPTDPLTNKEYTYSELAEGKAYQIKVDYEGDLNATALGGVSPMALDVSLDSLLASTSLLSERSLVDSAYAAPGNPTIAYIRGNYGGLTAKTTTGSIVYVLAIPSIITNSGTTVNGRLNIEGNALSGTLLFNGRSLVNATTYNPNTRPGGGVVYSGTTLPTNDTTGQITSIVTALKTAYTGADIVSNSNITSLMVATGSTAIQSLGSMIVKDQLGGSAVSGGGGGGGGQEQTNPMNISLTHSSRSKTFTFSWTAGINNGASCKLQYFRNGSIWTDINATTYNCDANITSQSVILPGDGWNSNWSSIAVRIIRTSDSLDLGTFSQNLTCSSVGGSSVSTPNLDENCNGNWDDINTLYCNTNWCPSGKYCGVVRNCYMPDGNSCPTITNTAWYCYDYNWSQIYVYSWYHSYTSQWLSVWYQSPEWCGSSRCITTVWNGTWCSYSNPCWSEYR